MADGPFGSNLKAEHYTKNKEARIIQLSNIGEYGWREENIKYTTLEHAKNNISRSIVEPGNVVIAKMMPAGRAIICPNNEKMYVLSSDAVKLVPTSLINSNYLLNAINSPFFRASVTDNVQGTTRLRTSISKLRDCFFPLPPLNEQGLIVNAIENVISQIDDLEQNKIDLQNLITHTKSKILDLAIHGKLVPQDSTDEPAEELLKRIATCDNRPYEKLNKEDSPFDLPKTWTWIKLPDLCTIPITDGTHKTPTYSDKENGIPFLSSKDVTSEKIDWTRIKYITKDLHKELYKRLAPQKNDILLAKNGTTGVAAIVEDDTVFDIYVTLAVLRPNCNLVYPRYLLSIINSQFCKNQFNDHLTGIGVPNLHLVDINKTIIPLPPLSEQKRIVEELDLLFKQLDDIFQNLF